MIVAGLCLAALPCASAERLPPGVDPETGFRLDNYRAPTPDFVPGGTVLDFAGVKAALAKRDAVLIDVYAQGVVADPLGGGWAVGEPHRTIPGAVWLPHVGHGRLTPEQEGYFRDSLLRLTSGDTAHQLIFFCLADCWHSWNAAKRAADWGYKGVAWYPLGTDGWTEEGGTLAPVVPEPDAERGP